MKLHRFFQICFVLLCVARASAGTPNFSAQFAPGEGISTNLGKNAYPLSGFTWECWCKFTGGPSNMVLSAMDNVFSEDMWLGTFDRGDGKMALAFQVPDYTPDGPARNVIYNPSGGVQLGRWYHLAGVADYPNSVIYLYVDGVRIGQTVWDLTPMNRDMPFAIGQQATNTLNGIVDEVRIWGVARSTTEIAANAQNHLTGNETGLIAYYDFNDGTGQILRDLTPNGNDGVFGTTSAVEPQNDPVWSTDVPPPFVVDAGFDEFSFKLNTTLSVPAPGVMSNDASPYGDSGTVELRSPPPVGNLTLNPDGSFVYVPQAGYIEPPVTFTYWVKDAQNNHSNTAVVTLTGASMNVTALTPAPGSILNAAPASIVATFSRTLDAATVNQNTCELVRAGPDGVLGTADDIAVPATPGVLNSVNVAFDINGVKFPDDIYQVRFRSALAPSAHIADTDGSVLDGELNPAFPSGDGFAGGDFIAGFTVASPRLTLVNLTPAPNAILNVAPSSILATFSKPLDPATVTSQSVLLVRAGPDGVFGTGDDESFSCPLSLIGGAQVKLDITGVALPNDIYRISFLGNASGPALADPNGNILDGEPNAGFPSGDNSAGGSFVAQFTVAQTLLNVAGISPAPGSVNSTATEITVTFNKDINPTTVNPVTCHLVRAGADGQFGTADDVIVVPASIMAAGPRQIKMDLAGVPLPRDKYRVTLSATPPPVEPKGYWKFDEGSGALARDSSGNGADAVLNGCTWAQGQFDHALRFNGNGDYADTGFTANLKKWTISVWVRSPAAPIAQNFSGPIHREANFQINWDHIAYKGSLALRVNNVWYFSSFGDLQANTWYHLAGTYDGSHLIAYKNGVMVTDNNFPPGDPDPESSSLKFGRHAVANYFFNGDVDEALVYDRALSANQIQALTRRDLPISAIADYSRNALDGEFSGTFPSGDGVPGGDFVADFGIGAAPAAQPATLIVAKNVAAAGSLNSTGGATHYAIGVNGAKGTAVITNASTGAFTYTPQADAIGADSFTFTASDGLFDSLPASVSVTILDSPAILSPSSALGTVGVPFSYQILATFSPALYGASGLPAGISVDPASGLISGTPTIAGDNYLVTLTAANASGTGTLQLALQVKRGTPGLVWNTPGDITFPTPLTGAQLSATVDLPGALTYSPPSGTVLTPGSQLLSVVFLPDDQNYNPVVRTVPLNVRKPVPALSWPQPAGIVYGTPVSAAQLNATALMPGTFTYNVSPGSVLNAGFQTLSVEFVPLNANYSSAAASAILNVAKASSIVAWENPPDVSVGAVLGVVQLNATANIPGTFAYSPTSGTVLPLGMAQTLSVQFTPADTLNFTTPPPKTVGINVLPLPEVVAGGGSGPLTAGNAVQFSIATPPGGAMSWTWDFGDGTSATSTTGTESHVFSPAGHYTVTITTTSALGVVTTESLPVEIQPDSVTTAPGGLGGIDSDGDGFSDSLEMALGTDPLDQKSTPLSGAAAPAAESLEISKLTTFIDFAHTGKDRIVLMGSCELQAGFETAGQKVSVVVGGVASSFTLDKRGVSKSGNRMFTLRVSSPAKGSGGATAKNAKFWMSLTKGSFAGGLEDAGFKNEDLKNAYLSLPVMLLIDGKLLQANQPQIYNARAGKHGSSK